MTIVLIIAGWLATVAAIPVGFLLLGGERNPKVLLRVASLTGQTGAMVATFITCLAVALAVFIMVARVILHLLR